MVGVHGLVRGQHAPPFRLLVSAWAVVAAKKACGQPCDKPRPLFFPAPGYILAAAVRHARVLALKGKRKQGATAAVILRKEERHRAKALLHRQADVDTHRS